MIIILETNLSASRLSFIDKEMLPLPTNAGEVLSTLSTRYQAWVVFWASGLQWHRLLGKPAGLAGCGLAAVLLQPLPRAAGRQLLYEGWSSYSQGPWCTVTRIPGNPTQSRQEQNSTTPLPALGLPAPWLFSPTESWRTKSYSCLPARPSSKVT